MAAHSSQDNRRLIVNDLLCFAINKYRRVASKLVKITISDFYSADDISHAKEQLIEAIDQLHLDKWSKPVRRRKDSLTRLSNEIDDIFAMLVMLDEQKLFEQQGLPTFVSTDPDKMPSVKLTEGDIAVLLTKLTKLDEGMLEIKKGVLNTDTSINRLVNQSRPQGSNMPCPAPQFCPVASIDAAATSATTSSTVTAAAVSAIDALVSRGRQMHDHYDKASRVCVTSELSQTDITDDEGYRVQQRRNKRKKMSPSSQPHGHYAEALKNNESTRSHDPLTKTQPINRTLIGKSCTVSLRASKTLQVKKAVYCLANIDEDYSTDDVTAYIKSLGVRLLTCYELPRSARQSSDSKSFRLCVIAEDKETLLDQSNWYIGVTIRPWVHKDKASGGWRNGGTGRAMGGVGGGEGGSGAVGKGGVQTEEDRGRRDGASWSRDIRRHSGSASNDATVYADTNAQVASMETVTAHIN